jgi:hypothetical protein
MSYPSTKNCVIKQNECNEYTEINQFGFCKDSVFYNSNAYCKKRFDLRCPFIWITNSIWRFIDK